MSRSRSEAARMLGVSRDRMARWERDGLAQVERNERGQPQYAVAEIDRLAAALRAGTLTQAPAVAQVPGRHLALVPPPLPAEVPVAQPEGASWGGDPEVQRLVHATARSRAEVTRLAAEVEEIRARAEHDEVVRALQVQRRSRRVEQLVGQAVAGVSDDDRALVEQLVRQRLAGVIDLEAWLEVAAAVRDGVEAARSQRAAERRAAYERAVEVERAAALREAARAAAAEAARVAEAAEAQRESATRAQAAAAAQQLRAQAIAQAVAAEVASSGAPSWVAEAAGQAAFAAALVAPVEDDQAALIAGREAGWCAAATAWGDAARRGR